MNKNYTKEEIDQKFYNKKEFEEFIDELIKNMEIPEIEQNKIKFEKLKTNIKKMKAEIEAIKNS